MAHIIIYPTVLDSTVYGTYNNIYCIDGYFGGENFSRVKYSLGQIFVAELTHEKLTPLKFDTAKI